MTDPKTPRPLEKAEAIALSVLRKGHGCHDLDPASGYTGAVVCFYPDDFNEATVCLHQSKRIIHSFTITMRLTAQVPKPGYSDSTDH